MKLGYTGGFTLVELIVVIVILAILSTVGFISLLNYNLLARDAVRISDIKNISKVIELSKLQEGKFPPISDPHQITFSGSVIWLQGTFGQESQSFSHRISEAPKDPLTGNEYAYSITKSTGEYQVGAIVERSSSLSTFQKSLYVNMNQASAAATFAATKIRGNYNGVFIAHKVQVSPTQTDIYILGIPTILVSDITSTQLSSIVTGSKFAVEGKGNPPASYSGAVVIESPWIYNPVVQSDKNNGDIPFPSGVIYKTTLEDFNTGSGKLSVFTAMKNYYSSSDFLKNDISHQLALIDPSTQPNVAIDFVNTLISSEVGGLGYVNAKINKIDTSDEVPVNDIGSGSSLPGNISDPTCAFDQVNFGECNFG